MCNSSQPSQSSNQVQDLPDWAKPYAQDVLSRGKALTQNANMPQYTGTVTDPNTGKSLAPGQRLAGFTPLQQQAQQSAANLSLSPNYDTASSLNTTAGAGNLQTANQAGMYGLQGAMAGLGYGRQATDPNAVQSYMNPYLQASLAPQMELMNRQYGQQGQQAAARASQAGAFGGSRSGIEQGQNILNQNLATQSMLGNAYNQAYDTAQKNMQAAASLGMQGAQTGLQGIGAQQAGYNAAGASGVNLSNIAGQQLAAQKDIIGTQAQQGAAQQGLTQQALDTSYQNYLNQMNYPYQQLSYLSNLVRGTPMGMNTQSQVYQGPGNTMAQIAGLGMMGYGLTKAAGGEIKEYGKGGLSVIDKFNNPNALLASMTDLSIEQLQQIIQNPSTPAEGEAAQEMLATKQAQEAAMQASEQRGVASAFNQLPQDQQQNVIRAAGGGILAFSGDDTDQEGGGSYVPTSSYGEQMSRLFGSIPTAFKHLVSAPGYGFSDTDTSGQAVKTPEDAITQAVREADKKIAQLPPTRLSDYQKPPTKSAGAKTGAKSTGVTATPKDVDQTQSAQNTFLSDLAAAKTALTDPQDAIDRKAVNDLLMKQISRPEEIRQQRMNDFLMQFGAGLVQGGSQPGVGRGLSGLLRSAGTAAPAGMQSLMENRRLAQAAQDNAMKMQLENYRYNIADRKNDKQSMLNAAQNMRMLSMQQAQLAEHGRHNLATERLMGQRIAAGNTSLENAMLRSKAAIAQSSMKQAEKEWNHPLNGPALRKQYPSQGAYQKELFDQQWGQVMPQLYYRGTSDDSGDLGG